MNHRIQFIPVEEAKAAARRVMLCAATAWVFFAAIPAMHGADIYGTIRFNGTPPREIEITPLENDPNCGPLHRGEIPTTHFYKVRPSGGFADVVVSLQGVGGQSRGSEAKPLIIDQKGCEYHPYVAACETGQRIIVKNSDPVLHNVHITPNKEVNMAQLPHGSDLVFVLNVAEDFVRFKCDVHPWMFAYVSVFDRPYFSVSGQSGEYRIHNVPSGEYTVEAMHRKAGTERKKVTVKDDLDVKVDFTFPP